MHEPGSSRAIAIALTTIAPPIIPDPDGLGLQALRRPSRLVSRLLILFTLGVSLIDEGWRPGQSAAVLGPVEREAVESLGRCQQIKWGVRSRPENHPLKFQRQNAAAMTRCELGHVLMYGTPRDGTPYVFCIFDVSSIRRWTSLSCQRPSH